MKYLSLLLFLVISLNAQNITIKNKAQILTTIKTPAGKVSVSPDGKNLAVSPLNLAGVTVYNTVTGTKKEMSSNEFSGWGMVWDAGSQMLATREKTDDMFFVVVRDIQGRERYKSNLLGFVSVPGWSNNGGSVSWVDDKGSLQTKVFSSNAPGVSVGFTGSELKMSQNTFSSGNGNYTFAGEILSAVLSPAGTKTALHIAGYGIYVLDNASGTLYDLGKGEAPVWLNDDFFAYSEVTDNGLKILSSEVVAKKWDGTESLVLTDGITEPVFFPSAALNGDVYCTTEEGKIYKLTVSITP